MTRGSVAEYAAAVRSRYQRARKREKGALLDEFCRVTGYHRKAAVRLLNRPRQRGVAARGGRPRRYGPDVAQALHRLWEVAGGLSGKLLVPFLPTLIQQLERHDELALPPQVRADLLRLSPATADRLLAPYRQGRPPRQPWTHRAAAAGLRAQVPLRTFSEWEGVAPGALQADLVAHCGSSTEGFYLTTLVAVDVATGWTELEPVWGKGESRVSAGLHYVRGRLPMPLHSLHTDYLNFFQPIRKVMVKERHGARLRRRFDEARTPYERLLASGVLSEPAARDLAARYLRLNPVQLRAEVDGALGRLHHLADHAYAR